MNHYKIHPIVMGTKVFDKSMMTYQHDYGQPYTIPIYSWYLEGGEKTVLVDTGEMSPIQSADRENAIGGKIYTFEQGLARHNLKPEDIDVVIHTHLHNDHCENDYKCVNAVIYTHVLELEAIHDPHPLDFRYLEDYILDVEEKGGTQWKKCRQDFSTAINASFHTSKKCSVGCPERSRPGFVKTPNSRLLPVTIFKMHVS